MEKNKFNSIANVFSFIPLSITVFGIFAIGFFVAPVVFHNVTPRPLAAETMTLVFSRFYPFAFICTLIALFTEIIRVLVIRKEFFQSKYMMAQSLLVVAVVVMTGYSSLHILPRINEMRIENTTPTLWNNEEFVTLHKRSEAIAKSMFGIGLIPLAMMVLASKKNS